MNEIQNLPRDTTRPRARQDRAPGPLRICQRGASRPV